MQRLGACPLHDFNRLHVLLSRVLLYFSLAAICLLSEEEG